MHSLGPDDPPQIGPYRLLKVLGEGGMGRVYLGHLNGTLVAVKVMVEKFAKDPSFRQRFRREMEAAKKIKGPFTVKILRTSTEAETKLWFASEYVPGPTLAEAVQKARFTGVALEQLAYSMCQAQAAIHASGVTHRDWKPSNIILGPDGARVIDFGVAYLEDAPNLTMTGEVIGTPNYMAPEQVIGGRPQPSWDIFALGSVLVFAATGRPPFKGLTAAAVMLAIGNPDVKPDLRGVPASMLPFIERCLQHSPTRRVRITDLQPLLPRTQTATAASTKWMPQPVTIQVQEATRVMTRLVQEVAPIRKETKPGPKPVPPAHRKWGARVLWFAAVAALFATLMAASALDNNTKTQPQPTPTTSTPFFAEIPPATFAAQALTDKGNPAVTKVVANGRTLRVTIRFEGNDEERNNILTKSCLKLTYGKKRLAIAYPNDRTINSAPDVISFGSGLDFPGDVYFFAKCNQNSGTEGGQKLGNNKVAYDGSFGTSDVLVPVIDAYTKGGKLKVVVPKYGTFEEADYLGMCLKTAAGVVKPTLIRAGNADRGYIVLTFNARAGTLYLKCSDKQKISYTGVGARIP